MSCWSRPLNHEIVATQARVLILPVDDRPDRLGMALLVFILRVVTEAGPVQQLFNRDFPIVDRAAEELCQVLCNVVQALQGPKAGGVWQQG